MHFVSRSVPGLALAGALLSVSTASGATLQVGAGKTYAKPCQAIAAAKAGDVIEVDAGTYTGDTCNWSTDNLTVRGVGGRPKLDITGMTPSQQKGLFTIYADHATIENLEIMGAAISAAAGNNGAGIRHQGLNLTVSGCYFHDNQDGILGGPSTAGQGEVLIQNSEFANNGAGDGYSHNMYIGNYAKFTLQYSYSHNAKVGHLVKSRAHINEIFYNRLTDETGGSASYELDLPNAGTSLVIGNLIEQSATTQNPIIVAYGEEGVPAGYDAHLFVVNNTFLNDKKSGTFVSNKSNTPGVLTNNIFFNGGTINSQASDMLSANFDSGSMGDPKFVDAANYDVHLSKGSPCIDKGQAPGNGGGEALDPKFEYVHPVSSVARTVVGAAIDIGAYEYGISDTGNADGAGGPTDMGRAADLSSPGGADGGGTKPPAGGCSAAGPGAGGGSAPAAGLLLLLAFAGRVLRRGRRQMTETPPVC